MKAKRPLFAALLLCAALLAGCAAADPNAMQLRLADLDEDARLMLDIAGVEETVLRYDYTIDDSLYRLTLNVYQLEDGEWDCIFQDPRSQIDAEGMIGIAYDRINEGIRLALAPNEGQLFVPKEREDGAAPSGIYSVSLISPVDIVASEEIPLLIQVITDQACTLNSLDAFFEPEPYAGYEYVYAVTVRFD